MECVLNTRNFADDDDCNTDSDCQSGDEECVDILNDSPRDDNYDNTSTKDANCNTINSGNKFSIDRILGINNNDDDDVCKANKISDDCDKNVHFVKPTPIQATHRNGK